MPRAALLLSCLLTLGACNRTQSDDPVEVYQGLVKALGKGEIKVAYGTLSSSTRTLLADRAHRLWEASDGGVKDDPAGMFFAQLTRPPAVTEVALLDRRGDLATLRVRAQDRASEVKMVREAGAWKLDLTESLKR